LAPRFRTDDFTPVSTSVAIAAMFHDLHLPWTDVTRELQRSLAFLDECELLLFGGLGSWSDARMRGQGGWTDAMQ